MNSGLRVLAGVGLVVILIAVQVGGQEASSWGLQFLRRADAARAREFLGLTNLVTHAGPAALNVTQQVILFGSSPVDYVAWTNVYQNGLLVTSGVYVSASVTGDSTVATGDSTSITCDNL